MVTPWFSSIDVTSFDNRVLIPSMRAVRASTSTFALRLSRPIPDKLSVNFMAAPVEIMVFDGTQSSR